MADRPSAPESNGDTRDDISPAPDRESRPATPLWVKVFGVIALIVIVLLIVSFFAGFRHGPSIHGRPLDAAPPAVHYQAGIPAQIAFA